MKWQDAIPELQNIVATPDLGLISDMDGTISHVVPTPEQARVTPRNHELLAALRPCVALIAVVSGRAAADVRARVNLPDVVYVGNHGFEQWRGTGVEVLPQLAAFRPQLSAVINAIRPHLNEGMVVEDKSATVSIHYRGAPDPEEAANRFRPIVQSLVEQHGLRMFEGRMIFEIRPPIDVNKGSALRLLIEDYHLAAAIFIGDDTTDVDALRMARQLRDERVCHAFGLGVESEDTPPAIIANADAMLPGVAGVEAFLSWLLDARRASSTCA